LFPGKLSTAGLVFLWLTGLRMIAAKSGTSVFERQAFLWKLAAMVLLAVFSIFANLTVSQAKKAGTPPDAVRMKRLGIGSQSMAVLAMIFAVTAFS